MPRRRASASNGNCGGTPGESRIVSTSFQRGLVLRRERNPRLLQPPRMFRLQFVQRLPVHGAHARAPAHQEFGRGHARLAHPEDRELSIPYVHSCGDG